MLDKCVFCDSKAAVSIDKGFIYTECPVCGQFFCSVRYSPNIFINEIPESKRDHWRVNCVRENIVLSDQNIRTLWLPDHSPSIVSQFVDVSPRIYRDYVDVPIVHADKPDAILETLAKELNSKNPADYIPLKRKHLFACRIHDDDEAYLWIRPLVEDKLLDTGQYFVGRRVVEIPPYVSTQENDPDRTQTRIRLTSKGWARVRHIYERSGSRQAFVAMSFRHSERDQIEGAIREACRAAGGYDARPVDRKEYLGSIPDRILAEINRSRFIVADFTEFDDTTKQHTRNAGVHFEAGYAEGRGIPVIMTVQEGKALDNCVHFDLKHKNLIDWKSLDDLKRRLTDRIDAVVNR